MVRISSGARPEGRMDLSYRKFVARLWRNGLEAASPMAR
jgi:hypothetical protein